MTTRHESDDLTGELIDGRYRVEKLLGCGGMGAVYLARDQHLGKPVVIKVPLAAMELFERFPNEIDLHKRDHPHIVKVLDRGVHKSLPYFVLQYMAGGSLRDRLGQTRLTPREVAGWIEPASEAIDFLHSRKIIHRDIKPDNILFDTEGHGFVADFGIAKELGGPPLTKLGTTVGTPAYMAPEAIQGKFDARSDQYALATTVYECLAGRLPYKEGEDGDLRDVKLRCEPERLEECAPSIPLQLAECVHRALARAPEQRYANCREFAAAFKRVALSQDRVDPAGKTSKLDLPDPNPAPWRIYAGVSLAVVVVAAAIWGAYRLRGDDPAAADTVGTLDCTGTWSPEVRWPVRARLEGFEARRATVLDESYPYVAVVDAGCETDVILRSGADLSAFDDQGRLVARAPNDGSGAERLLRTLYLRRLLLGPEQSGSSLRLPPVVKEDLEINFIGRGNDLQLRVWDKPLKEQKFVDGEFQMIVSAEEPSATTAFRPGASQAWFYVRTTRWPHLLVLTLTAEGSVVVNYPTYMFAGRPLGEWIQVDEEVPVQGEDGQDLVIAFASERPWSKIMPRFPKAPVRNDGPTIKMERAILDTTAPFTALAFVTELSEHLSQATDWSRATQSYQLEAP